MAFKNRTSEAEEEFIRGANQENVEVKKTKNFNLRLSPIELKILKREAAKNHRSMQQQVKYLIWTCTESKKGSEEIQLEPH